MYKSEATVAVFAVCGANAIDLLVFLRAQLRGALHTLEFVVYRRPSRAPGGYSAEVQETVHLQVGERHRGLNEQRDPIGAGEMWAINIQDAEERIRYLGQANPGAEKTA